MRREVGDCFWFVFTAVIKTTAKSNLGKKGFVWLILLGNRSMNYRRMLIAGLLSLVLVRLFILYNPGLPA